jgi:hypothetical protein
MTTNKYAAMSRDYMARAENYLRQGDLVQASEKSWGAAACALKSIAEQRGWQHQSHSLLYDISNQIADELSRTDLRDMFAAAKSMHQNFYENWEPEEGVEYAVGRTKEYVGELESVSPQLPVSFIVETRAQRRRLERLTGQRPPHDTPSEEGT